jgi:PatG C-terminal
MMHGETSGQTEAMDAVAEAPVVNPAETAPELSASAGAAPVAPPTALPAAAPAFVYALGQIDARFPSLSIEKEYAQIIGNDADDYSGLTERQALRRAISQEQNRYLARNMCWVLEIEGLETYILVPRDPLDLALLIEAYREERSGDDLDAVIGVRTQIAPPEMCNGLALPVVVVDQLYSFDRYSLIESIPVPESVSKKQSDQFRAVATSLFGELTQLADNAGSTDEHRALNYLTVRYPRMYAVATEQADRNFSFTGVEVLRSPLSGVRSIVDVVLSFRQRDTDVPEKQFVRVDVTEEFPFLVTKMGPYYDR